MRGCSLPKKHLGPHRVDLDINEAMKQELCGNSSYSYHRDRLACPSCGFVAIRSVWRNNKGEDSASLCSACKLESSAMRHERTARKLRQQATLLRARRRKP